MWRYLYRLLALVVIIGVFYYVLPIFMPNQKTSLSVNSKEIVLQVSRDGRVEGHVNHLHLVGGFTPTPYGTLYVLSADDKKYFHWLTILVSPLDTSYVWMVYHYEKEGVVVDKIFFNDLSLFQKVYKQVVGFQRHDTFEPITMVNRKILIANTQDSGYPIDNESVLKEDATVSWIVDRYTATQHIKGVAYVRPLVEPRDSTIKVGFGLIFNRDALYNAFDELMLSDGKAARLNHIDNIGVRHMNLTFRVYSSDGYLIKHAFVEDDNVYVEHDGDIYNPPSAPAGHIVNAYVGFYQPSSDDKQSNIVKVGRMYEEPVSSVYWHMTATNACLQTGGSFFMPIITFEIPERQIAVIGLPQYEPEDIYFVPIYASLKGEVRKYHPLVEIKGYLIVRVYGDVAYGNERRRHLIVVDVPVYIKQLFKVVDIGG